MNFHAVQLCVCVAGNVVTRSYLIYKWFVALFLVANQLLSLTLFSVDSHGHVRKASKYMIYATHWGFVLVTVAFNLDAILVLGRYVIQQSHVSMNKRRPHYESCHRTLKLSMGLTATAYPNALFVTVMFWAFLYDYSQPFVLTWHSYVNLAVHLLQSVIVLIDTLVSSRPWRLWHAWCPMLCGLTYMFFNVLYILAFDGTGANGEPFVYDILDWKNHPGTCALLVGGCVIGFPPLYSLLYFQAKFRDHCWKKYLSDPADRESSDVATFGGHGVYAISIKLQDTKEPSQ